MQVVKTRYKAMSGLEPRQFIEKKLYFSCNTKDVQMHDAAAKSKRSMSASQIFDLAQSSLNVSKTSQDGHLSAIDGNDSGLQYYTYFSSCQRAP